MGNATKFVPGLIKPREGGGRGQKPKSKACIFMPIALMGGFDHVLILILRIKWPAWWRFERCVTEIVPVLILCVEAVTLSWRLKGEREPLRGLTDQVLMLLTASTAPIHWSLAKKPSEVGKKRSTCSLRPAAGVGPDARLLFRFNLDLKLKFHQLWLSWIITYERQ